MLRAYVCIVGRGFFQYAVGMVWEPLKDKVTGLICISPVSVRTFVTSILL